MFTGIIQDVGIVQKIVKNGDSARLFVKSAISDVKIGESISINGLCLTLTQLAEALLVFDLSAESIVRSNMGTIKQNERVNIEQALKLSDRLSGHFVTGHIDFASKIVANEKRGDFIKMGIEFPEKHRGEIVEKGSIAVNGVSLTINEVMGNSFSFFLIPHTLQNTNLLDLRIGDLVNIETDILAKYIESMIDKREKKSLIDENFLAKHGFFNS